MVLPAPLADAIRCIYLDEAVGEFDGKQLLRQVIGNDFFTTHGQNRPRTG